MARARVCTSFNDFGQRPGTLVEATWRDIDCELSRNGSTAGGVDQLSGFAWLGAERRNARNFYANRVDEGIYAGASDAFAGRIRHGEVVLAEPALHQGGVGV